ncbi:ABC-2 type transport system ATP-binding protein [Dyadobacter sp. BE34]|uniref:ABC-2 type transport system ATP-binding protein n=1 Tax=Dyadobacter fermentans TaxID=94254 RepID=A0ABU1R1X9_9BACT|nr:MULTISPECIES: ATP-binding cassette domain-containing protein [Dyadobacter]MDR6807242.1 ABC-2 type transport system ATP-binding protein [Dyadobacter fermentans]MDR7044983.1 ABC-2 type transport system ATP-binding protein [Dyadobacter sp. BE242]MDR7199280.1 ABC-2 type transport system ATP-binding protein [Dyadobacter sp. BE34]MDR7217240.1 ABC-2 type transport system ATP-binding protein [Dyadobacter sp. BE31]MDR7265173.1 ABC-2 type transport system ATP-binding protein [Dyadobacter sp. BE32]
MILEISQLTQRYGEREILSIPSFAIEKGIYWIQGENGAGKSTLFRTLAGMLPFEGNVRLDGQYDLKKHPVEYRLRLNLGEAEPLYPSFLTPADLIAFVAEAQRAPREQSDKLIEAFGINYLQNQFGSCSSGMVKKVSLLLAFLGAPSLIILDEPLITIDREAREVLFELIKEYHRNGVTFLLSSHQLFEQEGLHVSRSFRLKNKTLVATDAL